MDNPQSIIIFGYNVWEAFLNSYTFVAIKVFLGIYSVVLFIDIVILLSYRDLRQDWSKDRYGSAAFSLSLSQIRKKWHSIEARLRSNNPSDHKVAVLEADMLTDKLLADMEYPGENFGERLENIPSSHLSDLEALKAAHEIRNRIVMERGFVLDRKQAEDAVQTYKTVLSKLELL